MVERLETNLAGRLMESRVQAVRKELDKLISSRSEEKLDEYLKKAVPDNGLENFHSMARTQTRQEMLDDPDPALKELQTAYDALKDRQNPFPGERTRPDFASAMLHDFTQTPRGDEQGKAKQPFRSHQFLSQSGEENWVYWRSEDHKARRREFVDIRDQVKDAWYLEQARKLARDEARRINETLKEKYHGNPEDAVKFLRDQNQGEVFDLTGVAHLVEKDPNVLPGHKFTSDDFLPYAVPKDRIAYPPADFVTKLLKLKERGDSLVLADQPVRHFYVAVLKAEPGLPSRQRFYEVYNSHGMNNSLWTRMIDDRQRKYAEKVIEQLRAEATKDLEGGEYIIPEKVRSRGESGGESTE